MGLKKPLTFDGVLYPTQTALALKLGVSLQVLGQHSKAGTLYNITSVKGRPQGIKAVRCVQISIGPRQFPSISAAARALNVPYSLVYSRLERGTLDSFITFLKVESK